MPMAQGAVEKTIVAQVPELPPCAAPYLPPAQGDASEADETEADWAEDVAVIAARLGAPVRFD